MARKIFVLCECCALKTLPTPTYTGPRQPAAQSDVLLLPPAETEQQNKQTEQSLSKSVSNAPAAPPVPRYLAISQLRWPRFMVVGHRFQAVGQPPRSHGGCGHRLLHSSAPSHPDGVGLCSRALDSDFCLIFESFSGAFSFAEIDRYWSSLARSLCPPSVLGGYISYPVPRCQRWSKSEPFRGLKSEPR